MKKNLIVSIIVSNYNGASYFYNDHNLLWNVFSSLNETMYPNYKILLADDSSTDNSIDYTKRNFPGIKIIKNKKNGGFAKNNNNAIKYALKKYKPDYILLLNNDIIIEDSKWLNKLLEIAEADSKIGVVGCKLVYPNGRIQHAGMEISYYGGRNMGRGQKDYGQFDYVKEVEGITFGIALINKKVIERIGLLDENFFMGYEDIDYNIRAKKANFKIYYTGNIKVIHLEGFSSTNSKFKKVRLKSFTNYYVNFWYFLLKYKSMRQFSGINRLKAIFVFFLGFVFTIEGPTRERKLINIRLQKNKVNKLLLSIKVIREAKRLYIKAKSKK